MVDCHSSTEFFIFFSFKYDDSWPNILHFRSHHLWNSTIKLILILIAIISTHLAKPTIPLSVIKTVNDLFGGTIKMKFTYKSNFLSPKIQLFYKYIAQCNKTVMTPFKNIGQTKGIEGYFLWKFKAKSTTRCNWIWGAPAKSLENFYY